MGGALLSLPGDQDTSLAQPGGATVVPALVAALGDAAAWRYV